MKPAIAVLGSSNTDMIVRLDRLPRPGETLLGGEFMMAPGGKGANQAVGAARAGGEVTFIARLGRDMFGDTAIKGFEEDGLRLTHVKRDARTPSGVALICVDARGQNCIAVAPGANGRLSPADVRGAQEAIATSAIVLVQLETPLPAVATAAKIARRCGIPLILNPAPAQPLPDDFLSLVSIITPNETEAELLTGIRVRDEVGAARAAAVLKQRGVQTVIITMGARGAFVSGQGIQNLIPGFEAKAVDTTAAGDIFNGALAVALAEGKSLGDAVVFAHAAASISVTRAGAQPSAPWREEIDRALLNRSRRKLRRSGMRPSNRKPNN